MKCFEWWRCSLLRARLFVVFGRTRFVKTAGKEEEEEEEEEEVEGEERKKVKLGQGKEFGERIQEGFKMTILNMSLEVRKMEERMENGNRRPHYRSLVLQVMRTDGGWKQKKNQKETG